MGIDFRSLPSSEKSQEEQPCLGGEAPGKAVLVWPCPSCVTMPVPTRRDSQTNHLLRTKQQVRNKDGERKGTLLTPSLRTAHFPGKGKSFI